MPEQPERPQPSFFLLRLLREPMVHFLIAGAALFGLQTLAAAPPAAGPDEERWIVLTDGRVRQLAEIFARTWQRPPTAAELRGLVDAWVKEEVYYREAVKRGLDRNDTLVRRRMQQKMEFLTEPADAVLTATESELQAHLEANRGRFRIPPKAAFRQIFFRPQTGGPEARARRALKQLRGLPPGGVPANIGDSTLLTADYPLTSLDRIARDFGMDFAEALPPLPRGEWAGPVRSAYGFHLVRITEFEAAQDPPLSEIRAEVEMHWREEKREAHLHAEYERLRAKYEIVPAYEQRQALTQ